MVPDAASPPASAWERCRITPLLWSRSTVYAVRFRPSKGPATTDIKDTPLRGRFDL